MRQYLVYCLALDGGRRTYVGSTNNVERRLRQHRGELRGGARYTKAVKRGQHWRCIFLVVGFRAHTEALSFEWHLKKCKYGSRLKDRSAARLGAVQSLLSRDMDGNDKVLATSKKVKSREKKSGVKQKWNGKDLVLLDDSALQSMPARTADVLVTLCSVLQAVERSQAVEQQKPCNWQRAVADVDLWMTLAPMIHQRLPHMHDQALLEYFFPFVRPRQQRVSRFLFRSNDDTSVNEKYRHYTGYTRLNTKNQYNRVQVTRGSRILGVYCEKGVVATNNKVYANDELIFKDTTFLFKC